MWINFDQKRFFLNFTYFSEKYIQQSEWGRGSVVITLTSQRISSLIPVHPLLEAVSLVKGIYIYIWLIYKDSEELRSSISVQAYKIKLESFFCGYTINLITSKRYFWDHNNFILKAVSAWDFNAICFSFKCLSEEWFLTERKLLTGTEEVANSMDHIWYEPRASACMPSNGRRCHPQLWATQMSLQSKM